MCVWPRHPRASMPAWTLFFLVRFAQRWSSKWCWCRRIGFPFRSRNYYLMPLLPVFLQVRLFFLARRQFCPLWRSAHARSTQIPAMIEKAEPRGITWPFLLFSFFFFFFFPDFLLFSFFIFPNSLLYKNAGINVFLGFNGLERERIERKPTAHR